MELCEHIPLIISVVIFLLLSAFFSGSETAFFSLSHSALERIGGRRKRMVEAALAEPRMLLVTILLGNLLVNIASTSVVTALGIRLFGQSGVGISVLVMTFLILIFGEIIPKTLALRKSLKYSLLVAPVIRFFIIIFAPVRLLLAFIADTAVDVSRKFLGERRKDYQAVELATAVETGYTDGLFDKFETELLTNLCLITETTAHEVQTPRVDVFTLDSSTALKDAVTLVRDMGFSRVPLYGENPDDIVGILMAKDLLRYSRDEKTPLSEIMRPARFVPDSKPVRDLFGELITAHQHMVIVVDEHGSFNGVLTLEDILEEIVGEIRDRREQRVEDYHRIDERSLIVEGSMKLNELNRVISSNLESAEVETVAGYLIEKTGSIPTEGESFEMDSLRFLVVSADRKKINRIRIEMLESDDEGDNSD